MKTSRFILLFIFILLTIFLLRQEETFQEKFALLTLPIKESYLKLNNSFQNTLDKYFNQADLIEKLKEENLLLRKYLYQQKISITELSQLKKSSEAKFDNFNNILQVQTISYKKLNDFSQIYLTKGEDLEEDKIYGLIQKNVVAGIALKEGGPLKGILLSNPTCQFSTFIGEQKTPGIAKGIDEESIEINFIPKWSKIKVGDQVVTSGLDNIFLPDIPVGVVTNILTQSTYKTAIVQTYADILHPNFFYLVKEVLHTAKELNTTMRPDINSTKDS
jgi:rod shape-determining protein MreC